jgi:hypothetical protein
LDGKSDGEFKLRNAASATAPTGHWLRNRNGKKDPASGAGQNEITINRSKFELMQPPSALRLLVGADHEPHARRAALQKNSDPFHYETLLFLRKKN